MSMSFKKVIWDVPMDCTITRRYPEPESRLGTADHELSPFADAHCVASDGGAETQDITISVGEARDLGLS